MFVPTTVAGPSTNGSSPTMARPIVVLPDPDSPTRPRTSPRADREVDVVDRPERGHAPALGVLDGDVAGRRPRRPVGGRARPVAARRTRRPPIGSDSSVPTERRGAAPRQQLLGVGVRGV